MVFDAPPARLPSGPPGSSGVVLLMIYSDVFVVVLALLTGYGFNSVEAEGDVQRRAERCVHGHHCCRDRIEGDVLFVR